MTKDDGHQYNKNSFDHDANEVYFDDKNPLNFKFGQRMTSSDSTDHVRFMDKVLEEEEECAGQCNNMKTKTMVSNEQIIQADAFVKCWNDAKEEGIDVGDLAHSFKPSLYTDVALHNDLNEQEGTSLRAPKSLH